MRHTQKDLFGTPQESVYMRNLHLRTHNLNIMMFCVTSTFMFCQ